ncbi:EpsG family protein [Algoriphagus sp. NG3]|uniref:EpsG family protein n=1 Tax=Algoriphagus sp. NG3 TaxID=3097546 RepID=UPI002A826536|nr:EpsG family protein [Algoriphagus sp. NG3]WPR77825.1 EpsG family protein [Algoriphagus sp. NG3]
MKEFLSYYFPVYFATALLVVPYTFKVDILDKRDAGYDFLLAILVSFLLMLVFGLRDYSVGTDTQHYVDAFRQIQFAEGFKEAWNTRTAFSSKDPFFNIFTYYVGNLVGMRGYFIVLSILYVVPITLSVFSLTRTNRSLMLLCFMGLIAFPNLGVNIVRSAVSLSMGVLALTFFFEKRKSLALLMALLSLSFHFSSLLLYVAAGLSLLRIHISIYLLGLLLCSALAFLGMGIEHLPIVGELILAQDRLSGYITGERVSGGFSAFIILFYYSTIGLGVFFSNKIKDEVYLNYLKVYITLSAFYFLTFNLNDSYRFGFISSIITPIIVCYPILNYKISKGAHFIVVGSFVLFLGLLAFYRTA